MVRLALIGKSLLRERGLFGLWLASLCFSVSGLLVVDLFRNSLTETLQTQGKKMLSADVAVSTRRPFTAYEIRLVEATLPGDSSVSHITEMLAMVNAGEGPSGISRLANVRFIDNPYPLSGDLSIESHGRTRSAHGADLDPAAIWLAPDLLTLMQLKIGDKVKIGELDLHVAGVIHGDSSQMFRIGNMAPRVYVHRDRLEASELIQYGSTYSETIFALLPKDLPTAEVALKLRLEKAFTDPAVQILVPTDLEHGSLRVLSRLMDFLGLIGLVTLCLGWIGVYYLGRRWLSLEAGPAGLLKCLGLSAREVHALLMSKLLLIMAVGVSLGGLAAWFSARALLPLVRVALPPEFALAWSWPNTWMLLLTGPLAGVLLLWPPIHGLSREPAFALIDGSSAFRTRKRDALFFTATGAALFFALTVLQARSWRVTFIFLGALIGTVAAVALVSFLLTRLSRGRGRRGWITFLASALWSRRPALTVLLITVSAMAGVLSQLVPTLQKTLVGELTLPPDQDRPALFLIDVQDEQRPKLTSFLHDHGIEISQAAPFIRARILSLNDRVYERGQTAGWQTREDEMDARFRNRGVNLSYQDHLAPTAHIIEGKAWDKMNRDPKSPDISVEEGYADRLKLKLGDVLRFDVQGVEVNARVASLRSVDWTSFEPNFFILFPAGVLDDAPKTWVMTIQRSAKLRPDAIQALLAQPFPNVTSINVQEALDTAADLFHKLGGGLSKASGMCLGLGLFVFLMILLFQLTSSRRDWHQLRVLGLKRREILALQMLTFGGLAAAGACLGAAASLLMSWILTHYAFKVRLQVDWPSLYLIVLVSIACAGVGIALSGSVLGWQRADE